MRTKKWLNYVSNAITALLYVLLIVMAFIVISTKASGGEPEFFGYQLKTVLSGSMEPTIKTGSVIAVKLGENMEHLKNGDIITFKTENNQLVTHRIVDAVKKQNQVMYKTKGDHNKTPDNNMVISQNVLAKYNGFTIPYLGYLIKFINTKNGAFLLIFPGIMLVIYSIFSIWRAISQIDRYKVKSEKKENLS